MDNDEDFMCDDDDDMFYEMDDSSTTNRLRTHPAQQPHQPAHNDDVSPDECDFDDEEDEQGDDSDIPALDGSGDNDEKSTGRVRRTSQVLSSSLHRSSTTPQNHDQRTTGGAGTPEVPGQTLKSIAANGQEISYNVLSPEQICQYMNHVVKDVNQVLQLPATTVRLLLSQLNWDKESLMERFFDDMDKLFQDAHVASPLAKSQPECSNKASASSDTCDICWANLQGGQLKGTDCGHKFCTDCWRRYLTGKIMDENIAYKIECPAHDCHILVDDVFVMEMINSSNVRRKYQHAITNSFVESHRCMRWCPGTDCLYAIKVSSSEWMPVMCTQCRTTFCFLCGQPWHDPVTCAVLKRWRKKCADDSETSNWISANTKECPTCHATIEKDGGCNHVVCRNVSCKAEFCWICLGAWQPHGSSWFKCNRFTEDDAKSARDAQEKSRYALQRYLFYFNRFMNHQQSLRLETKLNTSIRQKMEEMQQHNMSWIEVQFLQKAVTALQLCRQTLMFTYVFAFYLPKSNQQIIFEDNQHDLENATETLSGYLERDITGATVTDIKQKVQDQANYCESRRRALIEHVHEGYDKDWWDFSV